MEEYTQENVRHLQFFIEQDSLLYLCFRSAAFLSVRIFKNSLLEL